MAYSIIMPKAGMAMEEGVILEWLVKEGDVIESGDPVVEIETDKSTMEVESDASGILLKILHPEGTTVPVTDVIGWIGEEGEELPVVSSSKVEVTTVEKSNDAESAVSVALPDSKKAELSATGKVKATPAARRAADEKKIPLEEVSPQGRQGEIREKDVLDWKNSHRITPLAAKMAAEQGLNRNDLAGSGISGRVFSHDLRTGTAEKMDSFHGSVFEDRREPLTKIQKITGSRMFKSYLEIPAVTSDTRADVTRLLSLRKELNENSDVRFTINDFILKAVALSLRDNPRLNSVLDGDELIYKGHINIGMAVAIAKGLVVPVIHDVDQLTLSGLSATAADLAGKGRDGVLMPDDMTGGTFTISNIGMYGVTGFTPIINQPEAAILGVCAVEEQLKMRNGEVEVCQVMGLSLTFDHRIVDGAESSLFLKSLRDYLENPLTILV